jgi:hypothetical protein
LAYSYFIDSRRRLVVSRASGVFIPEDVVAVRQLVARDPAFDATYDQIIDLTEATDLKFDYDTMLAVAASSLSQSFVRRAIVARTAEQYSLACIFQVASEQSGQRIDIFATFEEAAEWMGGRNSNSGRQA